VKIEKKGTISRKRQKTEERKWTSLLLEVSWEAGRQPPLSIWANTWQKKEKKLPLS
jgi:hypothetical protein